MIFALMAAALAAPNVVVVWYHGCSDLFPCNGTIPAVSDATSGGDAAVVSSLPSNYSHYSSTSSAGLLALAGNATSVDDISDFFAVSCCVTAAGGLALLGLFVTRRKAELGGEK